MKDSVPYGGVILLTMAHLLVFDVTMASLTQMIKIGSGRSPDERGARRALTLIPAFCVTAC